MGDYKLKTSSDYEVPLHERVNTAKKREQLLLFRRHIYNSKKKFNDHIINLREKKRIMIDKVCWFTE
jgi:hypothetical protein